MAKDTRARDAISDDYIPVADRIAKFRAAHPEGSLRPYDPSRPFEVVDIDGQKFIAYTAVAYRNPNDQFPGIGTAWEPFPGPTQFTRNSELQNAETSAWGRAIVAALAGDTNRSVASAEEVRNRSAEPELSPAQRVWHALTNHDIAFEVFAEWVQAQHGVTRFAELPARHQHDIADALEHGTALADAIRRAGAAVEAVQDAAEEPDAPAPDEAAEPETASDGADSELMDEHHQQLLLDVARKAGWSKVKLLKRARKLSADLGEPTPKDVAGITHALGAELASEMSSDGEPQGDCAGTPYGLHPGPFDPVDTRGGVRCRACGDIMAGPEAADDWQRSLTNEAAYETPHTAEGQG